MKRIIKILFLMFVLLFLFTFLNMNNNSYDNHAVLTQEAIVEFEKDLKEGKTLQPSYYIQPNKDYNNRISKIGMKCSQAIEKFVHKILMKLLNSIEAS